MVQNLRKELLKDGCKASFGSILNHFRPKATQMLQMVSFGNILQYFGPKAFLSKEPSTRNGFPCGFPFEMCFYSKWLSIRNGFLFRMAFIGNGLPFVITSE